MKRIAVYVVLGIILFLVFLIANAPAVWLAELAARFSNGSVTLTDAQGTFWRGSGELYAGGPATNVRQLGTIRWQVNPLQLFLGRLEIGVRLEGAGARGEATIQAGRRHVSIENLTAAFPARLVSSAYPPAAFFSPTGNVDLKSPQLHLSSEGLIGSAEVQWRGAGGRFTANAPIGDYRAEVVGKGSAATVNLKTLSGDLDLAGDGQWRVLPNGEFQFNGVAAPKGEALKLEPLLRLLGRDLGDGRREIRFNGRLPIVQQMGYFP